MTQIGAPTPNETQKPMGNEENDLNGKIRATIEELHHLEERRQFLQEAIRKKETQRKSLIHQLKEPSR